MMKWQDISTAPKDGTVFLGRNGDHPGFGCWPMLRSISWVMDNDTGKYQSIDRGAWLCVCDHDASFGSGRDIAPFVPFSIAADEYNGSVNYEWAPLPEPPK